MISFDKTLHKYKKGNIIYRSVTQLIELYKPKFNKEYWSLYKSLQAYLKLEKPEFKAYLYSNIPHFQWNEDILKLENLIIKKGIKYSDLKVEEKLNEWADINKKACDLGTEVHDTLEGIDIANKSSTINGNTSALISHPNYTHLDDGSYTELRLYFDKYRLAGTADKVRIYTEKNVRYFDIEDYKTNQKITFENPFQKLLYPLDHLEDTKFNIYALQMSIYSYMLEQQFSLKYKHSNIIHFQNYDTNNGIVYPTPYLKKEVIALLKHYKDNHGS